MEEKTTGIKKRVSLGFIVIGLVLFFSSLIAIFEYSRMSSYVSRLIDDNISSINLSRDLAVICDGYNSRITSALASGDSVAPVTAPPEEFEVKLDRIKELLGASGSKGYCDSVKFIYAAYMQVAASADTVWANGNQDPKNWYFDRVKPYYDLLSASLVELNDICQNALASNSKEMQASFHRSTMPGIVAVAAGIIIVFLFNYFLNYYLLDPVLRMGRGIADYNRYRTDFVLKFRNKDEISDLYDSVKELMEINNAKYGGSGGLPGDGGSDKKV